MYTCMYNKHVAKLMIIRMYYYTPCTYYKNGQKSYSTDCNIWRLQKKKKNNNKPQTYYRNLNFNNV